MSSKEEAEVLPTHVLIFPLPAQGHMNVMLNLAQLLCLSGFHVTFIVSEFNHRRLLKHTDVLSTLARYPGLQFQTIPDGLPDDHSRAGQMIWSVLNFMGPCFKKMMVEKDLFASADRRPVTCIIADGWLSFAADFAEERGIPLIYFRTIGACAFWVYSCVDRVVEANHIPFQEDDVVLDMLIVSRGHVIISRFHVSSSENSRFHVSSSEKTTEVEKNIQVSMLKEGYG